MLRRSRRPLLLVGGGGHLSEVYPQLDAFVTATGIPVATTISGKGVIAETHPLSAGVFGRYSAIANDLVKHSDLLLVLGCKFGEIATSRWTLIPADVPIVHVDIDPSEIGKYYQVTEGIWADASAFLTAMVAELPRAGGSRAREQRQEIDERRARHLRESATLGISDERPISVARVLTELRAAAPPDALLVAEGGFATHWSALWYPTITAGRTYIANRGHAAIGYGVAGALGAALACPGSPIVALCGDGGFGMGLGELETFVREDVPVLIVVVNNGTMGYVKALQSGLYNGRYQSVDFIDVDYAGVARAFGARGETITDPARLGPAIDAAISDRTTTVLDVRVTTDPARMLPGVDARAVRAT